MLPSQLSRLFSSQAYSIILKRQQHVPSLVPVMLRSCIFHLSRISSFHVTHSTAHLQSFSQSESFSRGFSSSSPLFAVKKSTNRVASPAAGSETCQVFDHAEMLVGQMTIAEAEELARKDQLKLLDMGVNADGLRSFRLLSGRELVEEKKRLNTEKKSKKLKEKEFRITSNIADHDLEIKLRQAKDALSRGAHVKIVIKAHKKTEQGDGDRLFSQLLKKMTRSLQEEAVVKQGVRTQREQQLLLRPLTSMQSSAEE